MTVYRHPSGQVVETFTARTSRATEMLDWYSHVEHMLDIAEKTMLEAYEERHGRPMSAASRICRADDEVVVSAVDLSVVLAAAKAAMRKAQHYVATVEDGGGVEEVLVLHKRDGRVVERPWWPRTEDD